MPIRLSCVDLGFIGLAYSSIYQWFGIEGLRLPWAQAGMDAYSRCEDCPESTV